ncbi:MAG: ferritin family protein, partial [Candidatus Omnitrophica bacterium]|nr:ferritin family protein [Candidatus Omnitrophota bacterium]
MKIQDKKDKLVIVDFDEFEAYRIACRIEEEGLQFYGKLAGSVGDPKIAQTLNFLIGEEKNHLRFLEVSLSGLRGNR